MKASTYFAVIAFRPVIEAYELNTGDNCPRDQLAASMSEQGVPDDIRKRLMQGYELRRDVLAGKMVRARHKIFQLANYQMDHVMNCEIRKKKAT